MADKPVCSSDARRKPRNGTLAQWLRSHAEWTGEDCLIWPFSRNPSGYACQVRVDGRITYAHRHMCEMAHGPAPSPDMDTAHSCGRGRAGCVNPRHLRWATRLENMADSVRLGAIARGRDKPNAKLTEADVLAIRQFSGRLPQRAIAAKLGVSQQLVSQVVRGKKKAWVK